MRTYIKRIFHVTVALLFLGDLKAAEFGNGAELPQGIHSAVEVKELDAIFLELSNGMRIALKYSTAEEDLYVRLTALGGYSSLPISQLAGGAYAPQVAIRSGIGEYGYDQFYAALYENNVDFDASVQPFSRNMEATAEPEQLDFLLGLINKCFTNRKFTENAFHKVIEKEKLKLKSRGKDSTKNFNEQFLAFNTQDFAPLRPLTENDLHTADFQVAKDFFERAFSDPSEFVVVIVGPFEQKTVYNLLSKHLAAIPRGQSGTKKLPLAPAVPAISGIKSRVVHHFNYAAGSITRLTFPVKGVVTEDNIDGVEAVAHLLNIRLRNRIEEIYPHENVMVNVNLEFPFYPDLSHAWITVQYISAAGTVASANHAILNEIKRLQVEGMTADEITSLRKKIRKNQKLWQKDNNYWVMVLSNYMLWDWDPKNIKHRYRNKSYLQKSELIKLVRSKIDLGDHTLFSAQDQ